MKLVNKNLIILFIICFIALLNSCDKEEVKSPCNGMGLIFYGGDSWDEDPDEFSINLWINENAIIFYSYDETEVDWKLINRTDYFPYKPQSLNNIYEIISEIYDIEIEKNTPSSELPSYISELIEEIKSVRNQYQYLASMNGGIVLFKRVNLVNYN